MNQQFIKKIIPFSLILIMLFCTAGKTEILAAESNSIPSQIILSWSGNPMTTQGIAWSTSVPSAGKVQYMAAASYAGIKSFDPKLGVKAQAGEKLAEDAYRYEALLNNLTPGTKYCYRVGSEDGWSEVSSFTTCKNSLENLSFLYMGDVQYELREEDYATWGKFLKSVYTSNPAIAFGLFGGDYVNSSGSLKDWNAFLNQTKGVFDHVPMMTVPGNHETCIVPSTYLKMFSLPQNGMEGAKEEVYSFDYGNCHIVALNTCLFMPEREQALGTENWSKLLSGVNQWIKKDLSSSSAKWKFVVMHHPAYGILEDDVIYSKIRQNWVPLFKEAKVDVVFCGHQHVYMRTKDLDGITYIMSNSGQKRSNYYNKAKGLQYISKIEALSSTYQIINVNKDTLTITAYDEKNKQIDKWTTKAKDRSIK